MGIHGTQYMIHPHPRNVCCSHKSITFSQISQRPVMSGLRPSRAVTWECQPIAKTITATPSVEAATMTVVLRATGT